MKLWGGETPNPPLPTLQLPTPAMASTRCSVFYFKFTRMEASGQSKNQCSDPISALYRFVYTKWTK